MGKDKVRSISSARLRLDPRVLAQAEGLARTAGVSVSELIELLLLGVLDAEADPAVPAPPRRNTAPQARVVARRTRPARVLFLDDYRRRAWDGDEPGHSGDVRARASMVCRRAVEARARSATACSAARRAREQAQVLLEDLDRLLVPIG